MELTVARARTAHQILRRHPFGLDPDAETLVHYQEVREALDALWPLRKQSPDGAHIRQALRRLRGDAEFYVGLGETEVFRDADAVWEEYNSLERAFRGDQDDAK